MGCYNPFLFFFDPVLRAPTLGSMLMCLAAGLVGTIVFLRKQSLVGEALSHASYPGVIIGVVAAGLFSLQGDSLFVSVFILVGAFFSALLGLWTIHFLERKIGVHSDAALCFVLAVFFGIGLTVASQVQFSFTSLYKQAQTYLYGQAATMTDIHIMIYGLLSFVIIMAILLLYKELQVMTFDRQFAKTLGIKTRPIDAFLFILVVLAVVIGIRSVGVVLMSAMLIAPPVAARQFTNKLSILFVLSALFGIISGFLGNYFSIGLTQLLQQAYPETRLALPTGPMIVIVATALCLSALLFAPKRGLFLRLLRIARFRYECTCENLLKAIWRHNPDASLSFKELSEHQSFSSFYLHFILWQMGTNGWMEKQGGNRYCLTADGKLRAAKIVRLHRLLEVYLADYLGIGVEKVHRNAEEMEHILTPELERQLTLLLDNPSYDPHHQPIPPKEGL
jgi:manganese/zinc/iron transport system permease protein